MFYSIKVNFVIGSNELSIKVLNSIDFSKKKKKKKKKKNKKKKKKKWLRFFRRKTQELIYNISIHTKIN